MVQLRNRVVIAGTHSGVGKTTIATGVMAALRQRGMSVASAKVGPDYIDPSYHHVATGKPGRNLDAWMSGADSIGPLAARAADGADILVIEGVMGLFDGAVDGTPSSSSDIAELLAAPVVLVVDGSAMSSSVAALVQGFRDYRDATNVAGVILNRVNSEAHKELLTEALAAISVPVFGCIPSQEELAWRDRHLGLVPVAEEPVQVRQSVEQLAAVVSQHCDLEALVAVAAQASEAHHRSVHLGSRESISAPPRVAVAAGRAFTFVYDDNMEVLRAVGAELLPFDPLVDEQLPANIDGLLVGGGFPEVFSRDLSANHRLRADVNAQISAGLVTWVECGGLLWLCDSVDDQPMVGAIPSKGTMGERVRLGYRHARHLIDNPVGRAGTIVRGHEFHYSTIEPAGEALELSSRFVSRRDGYASPTVLATYLHQHMGDHPQPMINFVETCAASTVGKT